MVVHPVEPVAEAVHLGAEALAVVVIDVEPAEVATDWIARESRPADEEPAEDRWSPLAVGKTISVVVREVAFRRAIYIYPRVQQVVVTWIHDRPHRVDDRNDEETAGCHPQLTDV